MTEKVEFKVSATRHYAGHGFFHTGDSMFNLDIEVATQFENQGFGEIVRKGKSRPKLDDTKGSIT